MINFELNKKAKSNLEIGFFKKVAQAFSRAYQPTKSFYFSLALVGASTIKKLNRDYRGKNKPTDVLSFVEEPDDFIAGRAEKDCLGEILICVSQAKKQAKEFGHSVKIEMARLLVHGLAHLVGFEHEGVSKKRAGEMRRLEERVMVKINPKL